MAKRYVITKLKMVNAEVEVKKRAGFSEGILERKDIFLKNKITIILVYVFRANSKRRVIAHVPGGGGGGEGSLDLRSPVNYSFE